MTVARDIVIHFRLHFSLLLAPVFLLGAAFARAPLTEDLAILFLSFHVLLYGGTHAVNSFFDRDTGPVGGLFHPPAIPRGLLISGFAAKGLGLLLTVMISLPVALVYLLYALLSMAYSHPVPRLKARPFAGAIVVTFGQGVLPFVAGWLTGPGARLHAIAAPEGIAMAGTALLMLGLYPLSQIYQHDDDAARGDRTLSMLLGVRGTFLFAIAAAAPGLLCLFLAVLARFDILLALPALLALPLMVMGTLFWARRYEAQSLRQRYSSFMRSSFMNAALFFIYASLLLAS
jgi:4-hydroxybenzoate polyprenyltransferase